MILNYTQNLNDKTVLIIVEKDYNKIKSRKIYKEINKHGEIIQCLTPKPIDVQEWIQKEFAKHNIKISKGLVKKATNELKQ